MKGPGLSTEDAEINKIPPLRNLQADERQRGKTMIMEDEMCNSQDTQGAEAAEGGSFCFVCLFHTIKLL